MSDPLCFTFEGKPATAGSKVAIVPKYKTGNVVRRHKRPCPGAFDRDVARTIECGCPVMTTMKDDNEAYPGWREAVGYQARLQHHGPLLDGPLRVEMVFPRRRPASHYGTGRNATLLKDGAPAHATAKPDVLKLARALEDALTGVLWTDDSIIVDEHLGKRWIGRDEPERVFMRVWLLPHLTVADMVADGVVEHPRPADAFEQMALV